MFALQDLAFLPSRACHAGGYTSVKGRYWKRHGLLIGHRVEADTGDPIYSSADPFEMIHKLKIRPAFQLSLKHASRVARDMLYKVGRLICSCLWCAFFHVLSLPVVAGPVGPDSLDSRTPGSRHTVRAACVTGDTTGSPKPLRTPARLGEASQPATCSGSSTLHGSLARRCSCQHSPFRSV